MPLVLGAHASRVLPTASRRRLRNHHLAPLFYHSTFCVPPHHQIQRIKIFHDWEYFLINIAASAVFDVRADASTFRSH